MLAITGQADSSATVSLAVTGQTESLGVGAIAQRGTEADATATSGGSAAEAAISGGTVTSPLRQRSAILEIDPWTQNVYTLLCQLGHKAALFAFKSERKSTYKTQPCVEADTVERTHFTSRG